MTTRSLWLVGLAALAMLPGPLLVWAVGNQPGEPVQLQLPPPPAGWQPADLRIPWQPEYTHADDIAQQVLVSSVGERSEAVVLYVAAYNQQRQGAEVDHVGNRIAGKWRVMAERRSGAVRQVTAMAPGAQLWRIHYWFDIAGQRTTSRLYSKALTLWGRLQGEQAAAVVAMATPCGGSAIRGDCEAADARLAGLQERMQGQLKLPMLGAARSTGHHPTASLAIASGLDMNMGPEEAPEGAHP